MADRRKYVKGIRTVQYLVQCLFHFLQRAIELSATYGQMCFEIFLFLSRCSCPEPSIQRRYHGISEGVIETFQALFLAAYFAARIDKNLELLADHFVGEFGVLPIRDLALSAAIQSGVAPFASVQ